MDSTKVSNPFQKPNPFKTGTHQKFQHAQLSTSRLDAQTPAAVNSFQSQRPSYSNNGWAFNEDNYSRRMDFNKHKYSSKVSDL